MSEPQEQNFQLLEMTKDIFCAYISQNTVPAKDVPKLIQDIYNSLAHNAEQIGIEKITSAANALVPAVPIERSIQRNHIICLEDGKELKMLKRYLKTNYNMSPDEYRQRWNLPDDYPMVAPSYSKKRSRLAKDIGLGSQTKRRKKAA